MKRATKQYPKPPKGDFISIHALMKRATSFHCLYYNVPLYFNPRPHEEGDLKIGVKSNKIVISIHALMKRATQGVKQQILYYGISIHALMKRATFSLSMCLRLCCISIHALMKRATPIIISAICVADISIHALMKRATLYGNN